MQLDALEPQIQQMLQESVEGPESFPSEYSIGNALGEALNVYPQMSLSLSPNPGPMGVQGIAGS